jgi:hypothetical protein
VTTPTLDRPGPEEVDAEGPVSAPVAPRGGRRPTRSAWQGAAVLVGLAGVAITQPTLDMLGRNPEFFVAGAYRPRQVVTFALFVALVPSVIAVVTVGVARRLSRRAGEAAQTEFVLVLAALFGLVLGHSLGLRSLVPALAFAAAVAVLTAVAERRSPAARGFLSYLALGNVAFLLLFLFASPTAELISAGGVDLHGEVVVPPLEGPVVVVVLDEFPLTTILRPDGTINAARYPRLAELATTSTWFRNASSDFPITSLSAPAILSGRVSDDDDLPTYSDHPRNLFTLFAGERYPIRRYEVVTDMCPPAQCSRAESSSLDTALTDALIAYGHRSLPDELSDDLAPIDASWGNFGADGEAGKGRGGGGTLDEPDPMARWDEIPENEVGPAGQAGAFVRAVRDIDADPTINFVHVALPHNPWVLTPWGTAITKWIGEFPSIPGDPASPNLDFVARERYQLQSMQIGAVDQLVGGMIDHLREVGAWDGATVVVTSDHGTGMTPPDLGRKLTTASQADVLRIPLFVKAPGQVEGTIRDEPAHTYDVLPSLVDLLDIEVGWDFDGHSLFDGSQPTDDPLIADETVFPVVTAAADDAEWFPRGDDWTALVAVGEGADLVGSPAAAFPIGEPSGYRWRLDDADLLDDLPTDENQVPYLLIGTLSGATERPRELVVSVNGTLAGVVGGYEKRGSEYRFHGVVGPWFVDGRNDLVAFEVERGDAGVVLHQVGDAALL